MELFTEDKRISDIQFYNKNVYILCLNDDEKNYVLIKGDYKMLYNKIHKQNTYTLEKELLEKYNYNNFKLDDIELVLPIINISTKNLNRYVELYKSNKDLEEIIKLHLLIDYFNEETNTIIKKNFNNFILGLEDANYWTQKNKCGLNITQYFVERTFKLNFNKGEISDDIKKVLDNINTTIDDNYLEFIDKKEEYVDASSSVKDNKYKMYYISDNKIDITKDQINELFNNATEKEKYEYFNKIALSKKYTHLVVNNAHVLDLMKDIFHKYAPIYKYIWGYIWLYMIIEEGIKKTNATINDRFILPIDVASKLPFFPWCTEDVHMNPYVSLLVSKNILNSKVNLHGLMMISRLNTYGIGTLEEFKEKLNIFTTGFNDKNIFTDLNWDNLALSGSTMTACIQKYNPLVENFRYYDNLTDRYNRYFDEYYCTSDIDIMCNHKSVFDYIDKAKELFNCVKLNLKKLYNKEEIKLNCIKKVSIIVNKNNITEYFSNYSLEELIEKKDSNEIKEKFYKIYIDHKISKNSIYRSTKSEKEYEDYYNFVNIDKINISFSDDINKYEENESTYYISKNDKLYFRMSEITKYKIESPDLKHNIEFFSIFYSDPFSCVSRFHLGCVRAVYTGNQVYLEPTNVTSCMTGINIDYKYFSGMIDTIDIIIKNNMRGQTIILNSIENKCVIQYSSNIDKIKNLYEVNIGNKNSIKKMLSGKKLDDKIFKPRRYNYNLYTQYNSVEDRYSDNTSYKYIETFQDLEEEYKIRYGYDNTKSRINFLKYKTINDKGSIEPLKWWLIDAAYNELKN